MNTATNTTLGDPVVASERSGQGLMISGGVLLGTVGVFVEEAGQHPLITVWFRCVFGAMALLAWCLATGRGRELLLQGRSRWVACATGVLMVVNWALFFAAIPRTSIAVATVIFHVQPIWVIVFGALFLREAVSRSQWLATVAALGGLVLTTGLLDGTAASSNTGTSIGIGSSYMAGVLMCLGGSLCYAGVTLLANTQKSVSPFAMALWQCLVGAVALAWAPFVLGWPPLGAAWGWLLGLGVLHTGLAYVVLFAGMSRLGLGRIAVLQFVYPLTAVLVDWAVYGRTLSPVQLAGVVLMAAALWTIRRPGASPVVPARA
ncbi:EamA domain-containing membrane protein RarD [Acidovorax sp. 69]|uniref:DMT family transporter n=1 Tax=Acidovorax sp. 69 TaxID=2035202 RepID=UPI000C24862C|nr:EamA family transporter [Acidovorax sp. 69]PJI97087.1 EamA domain-containing membrane protein RarD [Acidovorax sp. 69]